MTPEPENPDPKFDNGLEHYLDSLRKAGLNES